MGTSSEIGDRPLARSRACGEAAGPPPPELAHRGRYPLSSSSDLSWRVPRLPLGTSRSSSDLFFGWRPAVLRWASGLLPQLAQPIRLLYYEHFPQSSGVLPLWAHAVPLVPQVVC